MASLPPALGATTFSTLAGLPDDVLDVAVGAALIAKDVYPALDVRDVLTQLDALAGPLGGGALVGLPIAAQAEAVSERFRELGFTGNAEDYYDPRNSLLPDVLERRTGIPLTLTIVWCAIARKAGVLARGVGFPGHFLARVDEVPALSGRTSLTHPVIVDPFAGGSIVTDADAKALLRRAGGRGGERPGELDRALFEPTGPRMTLVRLLTNLKTIWENQNAHAKAFLAIDRMVDLVPDSARLLRDRANVALRLGLRAAARTDFERVLLLDPRASDAATLKKRIAELSAKATPAALN